MREIRSSGTVRGGDGNVPTYSARAGQEEAPHDRRQRGLRPVNQPRSSRTPGRQAQSWPMAKHPRHPGTGKGGGRRDTLERQELLGAGQRRRQRSRIGPALGQVLPPAPRRVARRYAFRSATKKLPRSSAPVMGPADGMRRRASGSIRSASAVGCRRAAWLQVQAGNRLKVSLGTEAITCGIRPLDQLSLTERQLSKVG